MGKYSMKMWTVLCMRNLRQVHVPLDDETKGSMRFRILTALGCSVQSAARTLLRARGILNHVNPIGRGNLEHLDSD